MMVGNKKLKKRIPPPPDDDASYEELSAYCEKYSLTDVEAAGYGHKLTTEEEDELNELASSLEVKIEARKKAEKQRKASGDS